jgi:pimeloyl-ACP methyl ester carboxylesterase
MHFGATSGNACKSLGWPMRSICSDPRMSLCHTAVNAPGSLEGLREAWTGQFSYDPYSDLLNLKIPVLAIFGELDTETPAKQIAAKTQSALGKSGNKNNRIVVIPRATHGLMIFPEERKTLVLP